MIAEANIGVDTILHNNVTIPIGGVESIAIFGLCSTILQPPLTAQPG